MKRALKELSVDELVQRFAEIGRAQDKALLSERLSEIRRLCYQMRDVDEELRSRGIEARLSPHRLFDDPNIQVRLQAAKCSLGVVPVAARAIIENISQSNYFPQAGTLA